jgi:class 3 adenylate cyclase
MPMPHRRLPFSTALVAMIALVTGLTGAALGGLAWYEKHTGARALTDVAMMQAARLTADHAKRFFEDAEPAARLGPLLVASGILDPESAPALERYVLSSLEANPALAWVSYGDREDRFIGAQRQPSGEILLNHSFPRAGRIRLEEQRVFPDGRREIARVDDDHKYHPRERPYFRLAEKARAVVWTAPYRFFEGNMGITCAAPLMDAAGAVRGVFTVDLSLQGLSRFLDAVHVTPRSRALIATPEGEIVAAPRASSTARWTGPGGRGGRSWTADAEPVAEAVRALGAGGDSRSVFVQDGERVLARATRFDVDGREWRVAVLVPERDYTAQIDAQARRAAVLGALALALATGAGIALARWIARPLRTLGEQARRIRSGDLDVAIVPDSRDEIGSLAQTMGDMVQGLRDRDFIRDVLGRYVNPELAEQCLHDREAVRLGGELRTVSILMSDLRGFSALSERLGPEAMIGLLNRYLSRMVPVILEHRGTINEFIGDAILVLFGAPVERPDDAERAVRCAWAMQQAMVAFNAESRARGLPELTMGLGLHTGRVVAGNIGSADRVKYGVVGPAVNLAGRIESLTVGPQVLLSQEVLDRVREIVHVGAPREVALKGITDAAVVYELLSVAGATDRAPEAGAPAGVDVDLAAACYRLDGKRVLESPLPVHVTRVSRERVTFESGNALADVLDVKLVIDFGDDAPSAGSYARVATRRPAEAGGVRVDAVFTALDERDGGRIAARLASPGLAA